MANAMCLQKSLAKTSFARQLSLLNRHGVRGSTLNRFTVQQKRLQLSITCHSHGQRREGGFGSNAFSSKPSSTPKASSGFFEEEATDLVSPEVGQSFPTSMSL